MSKLVNKRKKVLLEHYPRFLPIKAQKVIVYVNDSVSVLLLTELNPSCLNLFITYIECFSINSDISSVTDLFITYNECFSINSDIASVTGRQHIYEISIVVI